MSTTAGLRADGVTVRFGTKPSGGRTAADRAAVDRVSFSVDEGEIVAILGPSGCGKSTLLRVIAGLEQASSGTVSWNGEDLQNRPPESRGFGLMFQDHALFPHRNVADNVAFGLKMQGLAAADRERRVHTMLGLVDLAGFDNRRIDTLSGGEAQRVALARALAPSPQLLMLDEPLGSLDRALRDRLAIEIRTVLKSLGQAAVHVTHDQDEAFTVADRVLIMREGKVVADGPPEELWNNPVSKFAAQFLGHPNVVDGEQFGGPVGPAILRTNGLRQLAATEPGALTGTVIEQFFRGDHYKVRFRLDTGIELEALSLAHNELGSQVFFRLAPDAVSPLLRE